MLRHIIWDVDGTLFDTYPAINAAFRAAAQDQGADAEPDWIEDLTLVSLDHCIEAMAARFGLVAEALEEAFRVRYAERAIVDSPPFPGVIEVVRHVLSIGGTNVIVTHRRRASTEALLAANDMEDLFAGLLTATEGYPRKPDPAMFLAAISGFGLDPAETIAVGDRALDVAAGRAAGVRTCLFGSPGDAAGADLVVADFAGLLRYLVAANTAGGEAGDGAGRTSAQHASGRRG